jgi:L-alanine-DL-glutamate epimerase-like enolase superfamily enzyme
VTPAERFVNGRINIPTGSGFGITLNDDVIRSFALPL